MNHGGKGSKRRPLGVSQEVFDKNWDDIFKKKPKKPKPTKSDKPEPEKIVSI
jgi:hypothetical protein